MDVENAEGETDIVPCDYISSTLMHRYPRLKVANCVLNFCPFFKQGSISVDELEYITRVRTSQNERHP